MEHPPYSQSALTQESLSQEELVWNERISEVKEVLEREIDFNLIGDIISELYRKSFPEIKQEDVRQVLDDVYRPSIVVDYTISYQEPKKREGVHFSQESQIVDALAATDGKSIYFYARSFYDKGSVDKGRLLSASIHESLHIASSKFFSLSHEMKLTGVTNLFSKKLTNKEEIVGREFNDLNEGLTELITDAIYSEYLARKGEVTSPVFEEVDPESGMSFGLIGSPMEYEEGRLFAYEFMEEFSRVSGLGLDETARSMVAEYFAGEGFHRDEIKELVSNDETLLEMLAVAKRNIPVGYNKESLDFVKNELSHQEKLFTWALFGRDEVGRYNEKIHESL
ncbi:MAG: hypothetical protein WC444_01890 [Candidatus Paceibacterota bacterium]